MSVGVDPTAATRLSVANNGTLDSACAQLRAPPPSAPARIPADAVNPSRRTSNRAVATASVYVESPAAVVVTDPTNDSGRTVIHAPASPRPTPCTSSIPPNGALDTPAAPP